jgi:hypothetical protein
MARYVDSLLTEGEHIVLRTRQHWLALIVNARNGILLWIVGLVILIAIAWFNVTDINLRNVIAGLALVLIGLGVLIFLFQWWQWWATDYVVTNRRLLNVSGILNKRSADSSLEKINDAILTQSLWGRMFNYGDLEILTAAEIPNDLYHLLNAPKEFKKVMLTQKHALETEYTYGHPPSPPLRATVESPAPPRPAPAMAEATSPRPLPPMAPEPVPATAAPEPVNVDSDLSLPQAADAEEESVRITETLARLADLRDQGAISVEEYEQKKDELLGRL